MKRARYYVGLLFGRAEVFTSRETPTEETHGDRFGAVVGPFRTKRAAYFMAQNGYANPHCRTVAEAERLAERAVPARG